MKYLFKDVLRRPHIVAAIPWPKVPVSVVHVLTEEEVQLLALQPLDIDSERMVLHIRRGKGAKPRTVMLAQSLLVTLRQYWLAYRPVGPWLFPSPRDSRRHLSTRASTSANVPSLTPPGMTRFTNPV